MRNQSRSIAEKFSSALAAAEHAAAQARDDDADSKASRSLCVAGLSSLLDGLLSAAPSGKAAHGRRGEITMVECV